MSPPQCLTSQAELTLRGQSHPQPRGIFWGAGIPSKVLWVGDAGAAPAPTWWHLLCAPPISGVFSTRAPAGDAKTLSFGLLRGAAPLPGLCPRPQGPARVPVVPVRWHWDWWDAPCLEVASEGVFTRCVHGGLVGFSHVPVLGKLRQEARWSCSIPSPSQAPIPVVVAGGLALPQLRLSSSGFPLVPFGSLFPSLHLHPPAPCSRVSTAQPFFWGGWKRDGVLQPFFGVEEKG